ncbi:hypothetical protein PV327_005716 [Microctonus hyperodae]|uniref:Mitochondrial 28S ribosomal protein S14 n=1 Tax=Microctonus hyperodae TaxID=165561 RepID=A0AA39G296_MICHY|nr:hypothetical protein PV327_005716 [Microctonus hyperodae]
MAALRSVALNVSRLIKPSTPGNTLQHVRTKYCDARMVRDVKRRKACGEFATQRVRLMAMKRNDILPPEIRRIADKAMLEDVPRISSIHQVTWRCVLTSRPRGNVIRWSLSRFVFRHLVDYNKLAGVQRAMW